MSARVAWPTVLAFAWEAALAWGLVILGLYAWSWPLALILVPLIATRQHALFILYHDAVHGLVAKNRRLNDLIVNVFAGVPQLLPIHVYRPLHLAHHRDLGTDADPERVLLYRAQPWRYHPLPLHKLLWQLLGDSLLLNQLFTLGAYLSAKRTKQLRLPKTPSYPETFALQGLLALAVLALAWASPLTLAHLAVLWLLPLLTLTQGIQKIRSFAEHNGDPADTGGSWSPGPLGRALLWPYGIQHHREHHAHPEIPWFELIRLPAEAPRKPGRALLAHLWNGRL